MAKPDRWITVADLFDKSLEQPPSERAAFLRDACRDDEALRQEIESLLECYTDSDTPPGLTAVAKALRAEPSPLLGRSIGSYRIDARLGAGGMGEVYRATDTRLHRVVAIKILSQHLRRDPLLRQRFEREARAVAALKHSHICVLHDIGREGDIDFLVMEHLEGVTLAESLVRGPLRIEEALRHAVEIADALAETHRQGIVHRDLKPGNIMLTRSGVKLLDFGLAKLKPALNYSADRLESTALTATTTIVGTVNYMSPEQLKGKAVDSRSDIFAFGAILYEMVTGTKAFGGDSSASVVAAILDREPPQLATIGRAVPATVERIIRKCLEKEPGDRFQGTDDLLNALRHVPVPHYSDAATQNAVHRLKTRKYVWAATTAALAIGAGATSSWMLQGSRTPSTESEIASRQVTFSGDVRLAALSPDGRTMAFVRSEPGGQQLLVQDLAGGRTLEILRAPEIFDLKWMPNGSQVVATSVSSVGSPDNSGGPLPRGTLLIPRLGGPPQPLPAEGPFVAISPDGAQVAGLFPAPSSIAVVPIAGGPVRTIRLPEARSIHNLHWGARTNELFIPVTTFEGRTAVLAVRPDGHDRRRIFESRSDLPFFVCPSETEDALYVVEESRLLRLPLRGPAASLPAAKLADVPTASSGCSVSSDGQSFLHIRRLIEASLWRLDLVAGEPAAVPLARETAFYGALSISPDGSWVLTSVGNDIVKVPVNGGDRVSLAKGARPALSRDGAHIAYLSGQKIWVADADGRNAVELKSTDLGSQSLAWLPDGPLAWQSVDNRNYVIRNLKTGSDERFLLKNPFGFVSDPRFSRDGTHLAVFWNREKTGLWVLSWPGREERFLVPDLRPVGWSADGIFIYALNRSGELVRVLTSTGEFESVRGFPSGTLDWCDVDQGSTTIVCSISNVQSDAWLMSRFDRQVQAGAPGKVVPSAKR